MNGGEKTESPGMRALTDPVPVFPSSEAMRPTLVGSKYMVSAGHPLVASVAARIFERGGNAIDAGVAAGLAANVVEVDMCNFGGIAPILVRNGDSGNVWEISGVGTWGREVTLDAFVERFGSGMPSGGGCAIVPAAPGAWITALSRFGTLSFQEVAEPAIQLATEGFILDSRTANWLEIIGEGAREWESSRAVFFPDGRAPRVGERLKQPQLGSLLRYISDAETGPDRATRLDSARRAFYEGDVADLIVEFVRKDRGWLRKEDLAEYITEVRPGISRPFRGWQVYTPDTWSQGPALLQALAILDNVDLGDFELNSADYIHLLAEVIKLAFRDREQYYGDPKFVNVDIDYLLSDVHAKELLSQISPKLAGSPASPPGLGGIGHGATTYLCTIDEDGNAFSATPSDTPDGGPLIPELGIIVSPRGVQSRVDLKHPNCLAPGKRPRITPAPAIAVSTERESLPQVFAFGSPGADMILQAMLQVFLNSVNFRLSPQEAVEAPRMGTYSFPASFFPHPEVHGRLCVEERIPVAVQRDLRERGHDVYVWPAYEFDAGGVSVVRDLAPPGGAGRVLAAGADPRRICYAGGR